MEKGEEGINLLLGLQQRQGHVDEFQGVRLVELLGHLACSLGVEGQGLFGSQTGGGSDAGEECLALIYNKV